MLYSHSHFAITPMLHDRVKQKVGCTESSLLQGTQHPLPGHPHCYGQAGAGQRLTMSSRMSTFSRSRLFSSSSCWFRLRKRCSSLRSPRKPPDSWRKEGSQITDCQPAMATSNQTSWAALYLKPSGHFQTSGSGQQGSLWGCRIPGPAQPHGWIYPAAGRRSHSRVSQNSRATP